MRNHMARMHRESSGFANKCSCCSHSGRAYKNTRFHPRFCFFPFFGSFPVGRCLTGTAADSYVRQFRPTPIVSTTEYQLHVNSA